MITEWAGKLTPWASVLVVHSTCRSPFRNNPSTRFRSLNGSPPLWNATAQRNCILWVALSCGRAPPWVATCRMNSLMSKVLGGLHVPPQLMHCCNCLSLVKLAASWSRWYCSWLLMKGFCVPSFKAVSARVTAASCAPLLVEQKTSDGLPCQWCIRTSE
jgi:hypothetical protein